MKSHLQVNDPWTDSGPANANTLRWSEFVRLVRLAETRGWLFGTVVGGGILGLLINPSTAWVLPLLALVVGLGVVFWIADRNAAREFWEVYARVRGYELGGRRRLPESTPLLGEGTASYATRTLDGQIVPGILECAPFIPELYAEARRGPQPLAKFGDAFRRGKRPVTLESEALGERFEILVGENQNEIWTRRLFSPTFVVWLAESTPRELSLELVDGALVAYVPDHKEDANDLDALAAAAATIARRLLEESAQTS